MKLFKFEAGETDWVAAKDEAEARRVYLSEYELTEADMDLTEISEADPNFVRVFDDTTDEHGEMNWRWAAEVIPKMARPGIVCSTAYM